MGWRGLAANGKAAAACLLVVGEAGGGAPSLGSAPALCLALAQKMGKGKKAFRSKALVSLFSACPQPCPRALGIVAPVQALAVVTI